MLDVESAIETIRRLMRTEPEGTAINVLPDGTITTTSAAHAEDPQRLEPVGRETAIAKFIAGREDGIPDQEIVDRLHTGMAAR